MANTRATQDNRGAATPPAQLAVATAGFTLTFWAWALIGPLAPRYAETLGLSSIEQSLLVATPVLVGSLGRVPVGALTDALGARLMLPAVAVLTVLPVLFLGLIAESLPALLLGGLFLGLGGTSFAVGVPHVNSWFTPAHRGTALGVFGAGMGGTAVAAFSTVPLSNAWGTQAPFVLVAVALVAYSVLAVMSLRPAPDSRRKSIGASVRSSWRVARRPVTLQLSFLYAVGFGGFVAFSVYLPSYLKNAFALSQSDAALRTAGFVVLAVLMRPVGGWLSDRLGAQRVLVACFSAAAVLAGLAAFESSVAPLRALVFLGLAAALGAAAGACFALVAVLVDPAEVGAVTGVVGAAGGLGGFFPPLLMGAVHSATGAYAIGFVLLALTALTAATYTRLGMRTPAAHAAALQPAVR